MPKLSRATLAVAALAGALAVSPPAAQAQQTASAAARPALDDPTIVAIFDAANSWDMETGALALARSHDAEVRAFAEMMVRDHKAVRQLGRDLAAKLKVTPTPPGPDFALAKNHVAAMKTLRGATGAAFDRAYLDHEIAYHQAVIDAVTTQLLPATRNAELRALEVKVAPNFQAHLTAAKNVRRQLASK